MGKFIKRNSKILLAFIIGLILSGVTVYATNYAFAGSGVSFDNTNVNLTKPNGDPVETIQDAVEAIYRKVPPTCNSSPFHLGDYIDMTPTTNTSTTISSLSGVSGSITPSELNVWRVIKINSDCTVEVVSEYVSTTTITLNGKDGYKNMVYGLNEYAKLYANTTYTLDPATAPDGAFRNVGYDGQTKQITDTTRLDDQTLGTANGPWYQKAPEMPGVEENLGGGDFKYATDLKLMSDAGVSAMAYKYNTTVKTNYWLASRHFDWYDTYAWFFHARFVYSLGYVYNTDLYYWSKGSFGGYNMAYSVRPVVTLKSGLTTASGNGTSTSHYTLSVS